MKYTGGRQALTVVQTDAHPPCHLPTQGEGKISNMHEKKEMNAKE